MTDEARKKAVSDAVDEIRKIEAQLGVTRASLEKMKSVLEGLAVQKNLFPRATFPPPEAQAQSLLYNLSKDEDGRFALYINSLTPGRTVGPHNHDTWAIVVSVDGQEKNLLYKRTDDGAEAGKATVEKIGEHIVEPGNGLAFMADDIHSISIDGDAPTLCLHMYGRALETLTDRTAFDMEQGTYKTLPPASNIRN